jgi:hypothetical protein
MGKVSSILSGVSKLISTSTTKSVNKISSNQSSAISKIYSAAQKSTSKVSSSTSQSSSTASSTSQNPLSVAGSILDGLLPKPKEGTVPDIIPGTDIDERVVAGIGNAIEAGGEGITGLMLGWNALIQNLFVQPLQEDFQRFITSHGLSVKGLQVDEKAGAVTFTLHRAEEWDQAKGTEPASSIRYGVGAVGAALMGIINPFQYAGAWGEPFTNSIRRSAYMADPTLLPSISDMVRFELREVFREPDRSIQLSPPPTEIFKGYARQLGFSEFWADSYWAAHWELPSIQMGFDMYHRLREKTDNYEAFTEDDLRNLLRKQDVLPAYHNQIIATAYAPFTRVDVRRMYKLKVLDEEGVVNAYRDLGYSPFKSAQLAEFTVRDIDDDDVMTIRSVLMDAYANDEVERDEIDRLVGPTFRNPELYNRWVELIDLRKTRKSRKSTATSAAAKEKTPTLTNVQKWFKTGLINETKALAYLRELKYGDEEANLYLRQWVAELES